MGLKDKRKQKLEKAAKRAKGLGESAKDKVKELTLLGIEKIPEEDIADLIEISTRKQDRLNEILSGRGLDVRVASVNVQLSTPPRVIMMLDRRK